MPIVRSALLLLTFAACGFSGELHTLSGKVVTGELITISDAHATMAGPAGRTKTPFSEILVIDLQREATLPGKYTDVELIDGSLFHVASLAFKGKDVELKLAALEQTITVPLAMLSYVLNNADEPANRQEWEKLVAGKRNQDILAIRQGGVTNALEGTLGEVNAKNEIAFEYQLGTVRKQRDINITRIHGMIFFRGGIPNGPAPLCKMIDTNQNLLVMAKIQLNLDGYTGTLMAGPAIKFPRASVSRLDFNRDKVVFLSDLKPVEVIEKSKQGRKDSVHIDKNLDNGPIQIEGLSYSKGLAVHSHTELVYALDGKYRRLEATIGMDDLVGGNGQPLVKVEGDGKELVSTAVSRHTKSRKLDLDIKGVKQLRLIVTSSGNFDFGDHVDFANGKLSK